MEHVRRACTSDCCVEARRGGNPRMRREFLRKRKMAIAAFIQNSANASLRKRPFWHPNLNLANFVRNGNFCNKLLAIGTRN
jgi:hypothetical protein